MRAVVIPKPGPPDVLDGRGAARPAGGTPATSGSRCKRRRDQLRRHDGARRAPTRTRPRRQASSATRSPARSSRWGRGWRSQVGDRVVAGTRFGGYAELVSVAGGQVVPLPERLSFEQGAAFPVNYGDRVRGAGDHGRPAGGREGADPRRGRRRRDRRHPARQAPRRRDLRHRVGLEARRDPGPGRRPRDRLPHRGLRGGGASASPATASTSSSTRSAHRASARATARCARAGA